MWLSHNYACFIFYRHWSEVPVVDYSSKQILSIILLFPQKRILKKEEKSGDSQLLMSQISYVYACMQLTYHFCSKSMTSHCKDFLKERIIPGWYLSCVSPVAGRTEPTAKVVTQSVWKIGLETPKRSPANNMIRGRVCFCFLKALSTKMRFL